ncbi:hypothetical protein RI129_002755 [Pyrocoelia pectoralis]|uniref:Tyr recombinase domain-containing protein n=1 Tax=Pyrocoelia pectoralis TaxID=417401 RepID=A0AAN7VNS8_9COLE
MSNENSDSDVENTPAEILEAANEATYNTLRDKSKEKYMHEYYSFKKWCDLKKVKQITENAVLAYFFEKSKSLKSPSLWCKYSMLRTTIAIRENIDIKYPRLIAFLKRQSSGYKPKKSDTFSRDDMNNFLKDAPDEKYLLMKVVLIFGITGACRCDELVNMKIDDVEDNGSILIIRIPDSKTKISRTFVVDGNSTNGVGLVEIFRNRLVKIPMEIAKFLGKPNPEKFTGHSLRRSSATLLVDSGADSLSLKRHGGWRSTSVAERYVNDSLYAKRRATNSIIRGENSSLPVIQKTPSPPRASTSSDTMAIVSQPMSTSEPSNVLTSTNISSSKSLLGTGVTIDANNCTFNIYVNKYY